MVEKIRFSTTEVVMEGVYARPKKWIRLRSQNGVFREAMSILEEALCLKDKDADFSKKIIFSVETHF